MSGPSGLSPSARRLEGNVCVVTGAATLVIPLQGAPTIAENPNIDVQLVSGEVTDFHLDIDGTTLFDSPSDLKGNRLASRSTDGGTLTILVTASASARIEVHTLDSSCFEQDGMTCYPGGA